LQKLFLDYRDKWTMPLMDYIQFYVSKNNLFIEYSMFSNNVVEAKTAPKITRMDFGT
jgi:hypothetical protein